MPLDEDQIKQGTFLRPAGAGDVLRILGDRT
jgi:hypothetical protein